MVATLFFLCICFLIKRSKAEVMRKGCTKVRIKYGVKKNEKIHFSQMLGFSLSLAHLVSVFGSSVTSTMLESDTA